MKGRGTKGGEGASGRFIGEEAAPARNLVSPDNCAINLPTRRYKCQSIAFSPRRHHRLGIIAGSTCESLQIESLFCCRIRCETLLKETARNNDLSLSTAEQFTIMIRRRALCFQFFSFSFCWLAVLFNRSIDSLPNSAKQNHNKNVKNKK
jgi:hypothetical protein